METSSSKFFLALLILSTGVWLYSASMKNLESGLLLKFGTTEFIDNLDPSVEREAYRAMASYALVVFISYPVTILTAIGYMSTTRRTVRQDGWLLMSAILLFSFIPVEVYCFWLDWKIIGLNYWGSWPLEEFLKAFLHRMTALAGLPFIAHLCYCTIPAIIFLKPFKKNSVSR